MKTVTKIIKFDYAHRLMGIDGELYDKQKCGSIHGHTGKLEITVRRELDHNRAGSAEDITEYNDNNFQFVTDFSNFKYIKEWINNNIDHATVVSHNDKRLLAFCQSEGMKHFLMPEEYSCANSENMLEVMKLIFLQKIPSHIDIVKIKFYETPTSYATWKVKE